MRAATAIAGDLSSALPGRQVDLVFRLSFAFLLVARRPVAVGQIQTSGRFAHTRLSGTRRSAKIPVTGQIDAAKIAVTPLTQRRSSWAAAISAIGHATSMQPGAKDDQARQQTLHPDRAITQRRTARAAGMRPQRATKTLHRRQMPLIERYQRQRECFHGPPSRQQAGRCSMRPQGSGRTRPGRSDGGGNGWPDRRSDQAVHRRDGLGLPGAVRQSRCSRVSFLAQLKRRTVLRTAGLCWAAALPVTPAASTLLPAFEAPFRACARSSVR